MIVNKIFLNTSIPQDVVREHINKYISRRTLIDSCRVNKYLNNEIKNLYLKNIKFLQKIYRKYRIPDNQFEFPKHMGFNMSKYNRFLRLQKKHIWYRYYIAKYPIEYVKLYPENLVSNIIASTRRHNLTNWIVNNLPMNSENRTRRHLLNFFQKNDVTVKEITITGW